MTATGKTARFALMNSKIRTGSRRSRVRTRLPLERGLSREADQGAPAAAACSHAAAEQPVNLLPAALLPVGLRDPVADRVRRRLELAGKVSRIATGADRINHLAAELR